VEYSASLAALLMFYGTRINDERYAYPAQLAPVMAEPQLHDLLHQLLLGPEHYKEVNQGPDQEDPDLGGQK
jgi:hypothetical protein